MYIINHGRVEALSYYANGTHGKFYVHQQRSSDSNTNLDIYDKVTASKQENENWLRSPIHYLGTVYVKNNYI